MKTIRAPRDVEDLLVRAWNGDVDADEQLANQISSVVTLEDAGYGRYDRGVEVWCDNGAKFQLTIVQSSRPRTFAFECPDCGTEVEDEGEYRSHLLDVCGWDEVETNEQIEYENGRRGRRG